MEHLWLKMAINWKILGKKWNFDKVPFPISLRGYLMFGMSPESNGMRALGKVASRTSQETHWKRGRFAILKRQIRFLL